MIKSAIATLALGRSEAGHDLISKLRAAASAGFSGVEIHFECLDYYARDLEESKHAASRTALREAAQRVHQLCEELHLTVLCLQPFTYFEGLTDEDERRGKFELLQFWFELCHLLGTDIVQIASNFKTSGTTGDMERVLKDLRTAAEMGLQQSPPIRFAYEGISWANYFDTWDQTWDIVKRIDLPNFGTCLDTFHIAGRVWADPSAPTGRLENGDEDLKRSLERLVREIDPKKIFYVQIGDAERLEQPIVPGSPLFVENMKPRMIWSRNARLYPFEEQMGGYLPVDKVCEAIFGKLGWEGWVSMEAFNKSFYETDAELVGKLGKRAAASWSKFEALRASWT